MQDDESSADFASVLGQAIRERGLTLDSIRRRLEQHGVTVSVATLSYWQNGRSHPTRAHSQRTLSALERVLNMPPGALVQVAPANPVKRRASSVGGPTPLPQPVSELLARAGQSSQYLRKHSSHIVMGMAPDRSPSSELVRQVVQCTKAGTASFPVVSTMEPGVQQEVHGLSNCVAGAVTEVPEKELVLTEMHLTRPLRLGEYLMLEYMTTLAPDPSGTTSFGVMMDKLSELVLEVQFPLDDPPARVVSYTSASGGGPETADEEALEVTLSEGAAQVVKVDCPAAVHMMSWEWASVPPETEPAPA
ncbi:hypothetical protein [Luteococcus peritonei]|uniref:Helix-turn-helix domain-containing protein n=1 Tax=Luteococcus peritonei TaxID=88874 RepID=A0ABW4RXF3_9ACTN